MRPPSVLFHVIVVMGASMAACGPEPSEAPRTSGPAEGASVDGVEDSSLDGSAPSRGSEPAPGDTAVDNLGPQTVQTGGALVTDPREARQGGSTGPLMGADGTTTGADAAGLVDAAAGAQVDNAGAAPAAEAKQTTTTKRKKKRSHGCPEGSESEYPPCFYIL